METPKEKNQNSMIFSNMKKLINDWEDNFDEDLIDCCRILMVVSGADGEVSDSEWQVIFEFIDSVGGSLGVVDFIREFDYLKASLDNYVYRIDPELYKPLLYSAIKVARADGLDDAERKKAQELASLCGFDDSMAISIENILNLEDEVRNLKNNLIFNG